MKKLLTLLLSMIMLLSLTFESVPLVAYATDSDQIDTSQFEGHWFAGRGSAEPSSDELDEVYADITYPDDSDYARKSGKATIKVYCVAA